MFSQYEEKRKIFTNLVTKRPIIVLIQTTTSLIRGTVHIRMGDRLKDEINQPETFLAVTGAEIKNLQGVEVHRCEFLAVNRSQIVWLTPESDSPNPTE